VPTISTYVLPPVGPDEGEIDVNVGAAMAALSLGAAREAVQIADAC
jgi:hypothetical protein